MRTQAHTQRAQGRQQSDLMPDGLADRFLNSPCGKAEFAAVHLYRMMKPHEADGGYGIVTTLPLGGVRFSPLMMHLTHS